jgi:hypothetical protein
MLAKTLLLLLLISLCSAVCQSATADLLNPRAFGAAGDRVNDDTAAFQTAINAGDILIPSGTYAIYGSIKVPDNRNIQCQPGAILLNPSHTGGNEIFWWQGTENGSLVGCTLEGTNTTSPPGYDATREFNFLVLISAVNGRGGNVIVKNNTFKNGWGNSELQLYGNDDTGPVHNVVVFNNEFDNCGYYGVAVVSAAYSYIAQNRAVDCSIGQEPDDLGQTLRGNIFTGNHLKKVNGTGYTKVPMFLTGGQVLTFDFSQNQVSNNVCDGANLNQTTAGPKAVYTNNQCINGCRVR